MTKIPMEICLFSATGMYVTGGGLLSKPLNNSIFDMDYFHQSLCIIPSLIALTRSED